jgi:hypothetical protein
MKKFFGPLFFCLFLILPALNAQTNARQKDTVAIANASYDKAGGFKRFFPGPALQEGVGRTGAHENFESGFSRRRPDGDKGRRVVTRRNRCGCKVQMAKNMYCVL